MATEKRNGARTKKKVSRSDKEKRQPLQGDVMEHLLRSFWWQITRRNAFQGEPKVTELRWQR